MPKIPAAIPIGGSMIGSARPPAAPDLSAAMTGGAAIARGLDAWAGAFASEAGRLHRSRQDLEYKQSQAGAQAALGELSRQFEADQDFKTAPQRWDEAVAVRRDEFLGGIGDNEVRQAVAADFDLLAGRHKQQFFQVLRRNEEDLHKQTWETGGEITVQGRVLKVPGRGVLLDGYAQAPDEATRNEQRDLAFGYADAIAPWAGPAWAAEQKARFIQDGQTLQVTNLIRQDPAAATAALADPEQFKALTPTKRIQLADQAQARQEDLLREQERQAARREREHKQAQEDNAQAAFLGIVSGKYSLADYKRDAQARQFGLADSKALYKMLTEEDGGRSVAAVKLGIVDSMGQGRDQRGAILAAVRSGELSGADGVTLLEKNRQVMRQEGPFASKEYDESKALLSRVFGQGGDKWDLGRQDRFAAASDELMQAVMRDGAGQAIPTARRIMARELERGIARPAGYMGEMSARGLEEHRARLAREFAALPPDEQARQAARYNGTLGQIEQAVNAMGRIEDIKRSLANGGQKQ